MAGIDLAFRTVLYDGQNADEKSANPGGQEFKQERTSHQSANRGIP
jgi:hypothetical protein